MKFELKNMLNVPFIKFKRDEDIFFSILLVKFEEIAKKFFFLQYH